MTDLLVEIGTEELPPKALVALIDAFASGVATRLEEQRLSFERVVPFASPRRLALRIENLAERQPDRDVEMKGPPVRIAFDDDGAPKPPATAFAQKCGVEVSELERVVTDKGEWLVYSSTEAGQAMTDLIADIIEAALFAMPIPRRMRWGDSDIEFVRPVHWVVLLYGDAIVQTRILGVAAGRATRGHRFHTDAPIDIGVPSAYEDTLEREGYVFAEMSKRLGLVVDGVNEAAKAAGGTVTEVGGLFEEVNALVEWPVAVTGAFEDKYLELPREVVISTLTGHQRYFPIENADGELLPKFITVANLQSQQADLVIDGNERVIRPRLADAAFFWDSDRATSLDSRRAALAAVVYQQGLGSIADKSARVGDIASALADETGEAAEAVARAAALCKCDLVTGMVGEFPDLQGIMGEYYATADGEDAAVATAIREHYQPRFSGDALPATAAGRLLAVADRIDTLAGIFVLGKKPSGNRDPFGLRRAALGIVRILSECNLNIDLEKLVRHAVEAQPTTGEGDPASELLMFITERLKGYVIDKGTPVERFDAVAATRPTTLPDFGRRLAAVNAFVELDEAESLAAANKRIANILKKVDSDASTKIDESLLSEKAEKDLFGQLSSASNAVAPLMAEGNYTESLKSLAALKEPVDRFFDDVMVMADDDGVRANRIALLSELRRLFLGVADLSRLSIQ
ncbi:MAG: glycine--tRNA ligase subunit beta [Pseudomonadota bacterium]